MKNSIQSGQGQNDQTAEKQLGQSLVEMAIMMVVLLLIMGGVLDFGRMYFTYLALQNAAGEGAAYGAIYPTCELPASGTQCGDPNNIEYRVQNESDAGLIDWSDTDVTVDYDPAGIAGGLPITVSVAYTYTVITPMIQVFTGQELRLRATDTQLIFVDPEE